MTYAAHLSKIRLASDCARPGDSRAHILKGWESLCAGLAGSAYRPHQREAIDAFTKHLSSGNGTGYAVIPTAGGKTRIFMGLVAATYTPMQGSGSALPNTVVLVPSRTLIRQTLHEFAAQHPGIPTGYLAAKQVYNAAGQPIRRSLAPVTLMTYHRFTRMVEAGAITPDDIDHLVMDEAHRGLSDLRRELVMPFVESRSTVVSAFTATPTFDQGKALSTFLGTQNETIRVPHQRLRDERVLAPIKNYLLAVKIKGDLPRGRRERLLLKRKAHVEEVLDFLKTITEESGRSILDKLTVFYGSDRGHARMFAAEYNRRLEPGGKRMVVLTGDDTPESIEDALEGIRTGKVTGVANAKLLTEGWDLPAIGLVVSAPTSSLVDELQRAGRAMRYNPDVGEAEQTAYILNTYLDVNGRIQGRPRYLAEALADNSILQYATREPMDAATVDLSHYRGSEYQDENTDNASDERDDPTVGLSEPDTEQDANEAFEPAREPDAKEWVSLRRASREAVPRGPFQTSHDLSGVFDFLRRRDDVVPRRWVDAPEITDEWLNARALREALRIDAENPDFKKALADLEETMGTGHATLGGNSFRYEVRTSGNIPCPCLHVDEVPRLAAYLGRHLLSDLKPFEEGHINKRIARDRMTIRAGGREAERTGLKEFQETWNAIVEGFDPSLGHSMVGGEVVASCYVKTNFTTTFVLEEAGFQWLRQKLGKADRKAIPAITQDMLPKHLVARAVSVNSPKLNQAWIEMKSASDAGKQPTIGGTEVIAGYRRHSQGLTYCLSITSLDVLREYIRNSESIDTTTWLSTSRLGEIFNVKPGYIAQNLKEIEEMSVNSTGITFKRLKHNGKQGFFVHKDCLVKFADFIKIPLGGWTDRGVDWIPRSEYAKSIRMDNMNQSLKWIYSEVTRLACDLPREIEVDGLRLLAKVHPTKSGPLACIHSSSTKALTQYLRPGNSETAPKTDDEDADHVSAPGFN